MSADEARAVRAAIQAAPVSELLTRAYEITHMLHAGCPASVSTHPEGRAMWEVDTRAARDLINAEIMRRLDEQQRVIDERTDLLRHAESLLSDARYRGADPGLSRAWGRTKRQVRDRILNLLAGA